MCVIVLIVFGVSSIKERTCIKTGFVSRRYLRCGRGQTCNRQAYLVYFIRQRPNPDTLGKTVCDIAVTCSHVPNKLYRGRDSDAVPIELKICLGAEHLCGDLSCVGS